MTDKEYIERLQKMTDRELIEDVREQAEGTSFTYSRAWHTRVADRMEALLAENERLKAGKDTNVPADQGIAEAFADQWGSLSPTVEKG